MAEYWQFHRGYPKYSPEMSNGKDCWPIKAIETPVGHLEGCLEEEVMLADT